MANNNLTTIHTTNIVELNKLKTSHWCLKIKPVLNKQNATQQSIANEDAYRWFQSVKFLYIIDYIEMLP